MIFQHFLSLHFSYVVCFPDDPILWWDLNSFGNGTIISNTDSTQMGQLLPGTSIAFDDVRYNGFAQLINNYSGIVLPIIKACLVNVTTCTNGFTLSFWIKWNSIGDELENKYIFSTKFFNMKHVLPEFTVIEVWNGTHLWTVFNDLFEKSNKWMFYTIVWDRKCLYLFVDGKQKNDECLETPKKDLLYNTTDSNSLLFGIQPDKHKSHKASTESTGVSIDEIMIWNKALTQLNVTYLAKKGI